MSATQTTVRRHGNYSAPELARILMRDLGDEHRDQVEYDSRVMAGAGDALRALRGADRVIRDLFEEFLPHDQARYVKEIAAIRLAILAGEP